MITPSPQKLEQLKLMLDRGRAENGTPHGLVLERAQKWILHFNIEHVHGPEEVTYAEDELVVVCPVRDGRPYVRSFVEHYRSLGVKHLFFLDNGSADGTVEALKGYENVTVLRTTLPYKRYEYPMTQYLIERFGRGRWCLCVDIDELFDYPYSDVVELDSFLGYLNEGSYTAVVAQMLDMFSEEPSSEAASKEGEPLKEQHRFYDISNVRKWSYDTKIADAWDHWAYRRGLYDSSEICAQGYPAANTSNARGHWAFRRACGTGNVLASEDIEVHTHGIQSTIFGGSSPLTKHPLVFVDEKIKPKDLSAHSVSNARIADFTCVLFHYKFLKNHLHERVRQVVRQDWFSPKYGGKYKKWLGVLEKNPSLPVKGETATELRSINDLVENQFLVVSEEYMMFVYDQQRKKGGDHDPRRGGPGGGAQDEAAFDRTRAQAEVQTLRAKRLQRRLQDLTELHQRELQKLREHNQRELDKLRGQYQRRIEKLTRKLARTKKKTKKNNRALTNQLRSIRASRSWRLLNKLGRLRTRVLGRKR